MSHYHYFITYFIFLITVPIFGQFENFHDNIKNNCKYCHINELEINSDQKIIWQKNSESNYYTPYNSSTLDADVPIPMGSSKLCLSCHDGTLSMEHLNLPNLSTTQVIGTNLESSHPVSFKYDSYLAIRDGELNDPNSAPSGFGGTINSDLLVDGNLECISCHDIHGFNRNRNLLVMSNYRSKLCLTCHAK